MGGTSGIPIERLREDAESRGANCRECSLNQSRPVFAIRNPRARLVVLGEAPGHTEEHEGEFFVGESGKFLDSHLDAIGVSRGDLYITDTVLCRPQNKLSPGEWGKAIACCRPRLERELLSLRPRTIFGLGLRALQTITGKRKLVPWVGGIHKALAPLEEFQFLGTFHPNFILAPGKDQYTPVFRSHLLAAWSVAIGEQKPWHWGKLITKGPYAPHLEKLLKEKSISVDIENVPQSGRIRCIGVGSEALGVSVPIRPEGDATESDVRALKKLLASKQEKIFHNAPHDLIETKKLGWEINGPVFDTLRAHAICAPLLPHKLAFVFAAEFPGAPNWKSDFKVTGEDKGSALAWWEKAPLDALLLYNSKDNIAQARLAKRLKSRLKKMHHGESLYKQTIDNMLVGIEMTRHGVPTDKTKFDSHRIKLRRKRREAARELRLIARAVGKPNWETFKIGSQAELHDLFFARMKVTQRRFSEVTGKAKLDEKALQPLVASQNKFHAAAARSLLRVRRWHKLLQTYVLGLPVDPRTGRVHTSWREFGTVTGRWSSSPNLQNIPKPVVRKLKDGTKKVMVPGLRDLFCAEAGHTLVAADYSQLELRIVALLSGDELLIQWYNEGKDVHQLNAMDLFQTPTPAKEQRDLAKTYVYACNYGAMPETIWSGLVLDFPRISLALVQRLQMLWFKKHHWIRTWQNKTLEFARINKFVEAPLSGRREYFYRRIEPNKALNFGVQTTAADIINGAVKPIHLGLRVLGGALIMQIHDDLTAHVPKNRIRESIALMRRHMEQTITLNGHTMKFPVDFKVGTNWGSMEEWK